MTRVKICGITNAEDARVAVEAGADLVGFIFYEPSPRYVSPDIVRSIILGQRSKAGPRPVFVGVFVNMPLESIRETLEFCGLDAAQLHGDEPLEMLIHLSGRAYKALRPQTLQDVELAINEFQLTRRSDSEKDSPLLASRETGSELPEFLLDAYHPTLYGGTGRVTDWTIAADIACKHRILLAGSLTPDNVAEAVRMIQPWGVDVSSGVEAAKGLKDHKKVKAFIQTVKG